MSTTTECPKCEGTPEHTYLVHDGRGGYVDRTDVCTHCDGTGEDPFPSAVERNLQGLRGLVHGLAHQCPECPEATGDPDTDSELATITFARGCCDSCGSGLAGSRHTMHAWDDHGGMYHLEVCTDCLMYHANGELPTA